MTWAYSVAAASRSSAPSAAGIENRRAAENGSVANSCCSAGTSLRSGEPDGTKRSSPQMTSTRLQSRASAAVVASAAQTFSMIDPAVSATTARPWSACAPASTCTVRSATAAARLPGVGEGLDLRHRQASCASAGSCQMCVRTDERSDSPVCPVIAPSASA